VPWQGIHCFSASSSLCVLDILHCMFVLKMHKFTSSCAFMILCVISWFSKLFTIYNIMHVLRKDKNDWVKKCIDYEAEGVRRGGRPKKT